VWQGEDDSLLDEYERLRREVATEFVQADSHANWLALREPDPARRAELQDELRAVAEDPQLHLERMRRAAMLDAVRSSL
jgi:3-(3-hydroxy-phenyl)propionate hydroxylase